MSEALEQKVEFRLAQIKTEEFAVIDGVYQPGKETFVGSQLNYGFIIQSLVIIVNGKFSFSQDENPYLLLGLTCWYQMSPKDWDIFFEKETGRLTLPMQVAQIFANLLVGTARGVVHTKTEGQPFHTVVLPPINLNELIKTDILMEPNRQES